jgi:hypothetical protein
MWLIWLRPLAVPRWSKPMKKRFRARISRVLNRPDLIYAGIVAMIICVALIARGIGPPT